jgi:nucleotide-binding universal stress UspA family protein
MPHRILVGVDDSLASRRALERAIRIAAEGNGRIGLLASAPNPPLVIATSPIVPPASRSQLSDEMVAWARDCVEEATELVPDDIPVMKLVAHGEPSAALRDEVERGCWDLVVVGQSARRLRLGRSVGARLRRRGVPVLVVGEPAPDRRPRRRRERREPRATPPVAAKGV